MLPRYWPWVQVLRSCTRRSGGALLDDDDLGTGAAHLAQIVPELRRGGPGVPPGPGVEGADEDTRFGLFDAVGRLLQRAAEREPLVVVLDDLHAADPPSLLLLQFVAREVRRSRVLLLGSYRDTAARPSPEVAALLAGLARDARRLHLRGLTPGDVTALVDEACVGASDASLAREVHRVTDGNPFFVDEVVRLLGAEGRLEGALPSGEPLGVPGGVRDAIGQRVALLSPETGAVLTVAAVVGRDFDARVVERAAGSTADDVSAALEEAVSAGLVVEALRAVRRYSFRHALVRETLYDALPVARRARLHQAVGDALEELLGDHAVGDHVAELAHHFFEAATVGGAEKALELSALAAHRAREVLAYEEGRGHYDRALQLISLVPSSGEPRRGELLLRRAECEWGAGASAAARSTFLEAAAVARRTRTAELLARAALGHARGLGGFVHVVRADESIIALLEEALAVLDDRDSALRARLLARLAVELYYTDQVDRRVALSSEAVAMARRLDDPGSLLVALYSRHWAACGPETLEERLVNATEMIQLAGEVRNVEMTFLGHNVRVACLLELCDVDAVDREVQAMVALAEQVRQPFYRWRTTCLRATRAILDARFDDAERLADEAFAMGSDPEIAAVVRDGGQTFAIRFGQGRLAELEPSVLAFTRRYPWIQPWRLPLLHAELGREAEARAEVERQGAHDFADFPRDALWVTRIAALARACALGGDARRAQQLYDLLLPFADRSVTTIADHSYGPVATYLGMLATVLQRWQDAEGHFGAGLDRCRELRAPALTARHLVEHARMRLRRDAHGDRERALALLDDAEALCARHDMQGVLERVLAARATATARELPPADCRFELTGESWTIAFRGDVFSLKDAKGLRYLAQLLAQPGTEVHALDMVAAAGPRSGDAGVALGVAEAVQAGLAVSRPQGVGPVLDAQAKRAYRRRLDELESEVDEAHAARDPERAARGEQERSALIRQLAAAVGLGGRDREQSAPAERARVNVTRSIRSSIARIEARSPALARHLDSTIRTGTSCAYLPRADSGVAWRV